MKMGAREETQGASRWGAKGQGGFPPQDGLQGIFPKCGRGEAGTRLPPGLPTVSTPWNPGQHNLAFARDHQDTVDGH